MASILAACKVTNVTIVDVPEGIPEAHGAIIQELALRSGTTAEPVSLRRENADIRALELNLLSFASFSASK